MVSNSDGAGKGPNQGGPASGSPGKDNPTSTSKPGETASGIPNVGQPKKPGAIIDLKATEIVDPKGAGKASPGADAKGAAPGSTDAQKTDAGKAGSGKAEIKSEASPATAKVDPKTGIAPGAKDAASKDPASKDATSKDAGGATKDGDPKAKAGTTQATTTGAAAAGANATQPRARSGGSGIVSAFSHMAAGVIGGFLALLGADTISQQLGMPLPRPAAGVPEDVKQRLAALEQTAARPTAVPADLAKQLADAQARLSGMDALKAELAALTQQQAKLAEAQQAAGSAATAGGSAAAQGSSDRLDKLEQMLQALAAAAGSDQQRGRIPQLAALAGKMSDLETSVGNQITAARRSLNQEVDGRMQQVAEASEAARAATQRFDRELSGVKAESARQSQRLETLKSTDDRLEQTLRVVQEETGALRSSVDGLKGDLAQQLKSVARPTDVSSAVLPVTSKLASLEQDLAKVVKSETERRANAERIVLSLELANLKRAIDRGGAYAAELAAVKAAAGGALQLGALETFKDRGVPTLPQIAAEFQSVAHRIIDADAEAANASVVDRLLLGAKSVVRVRRTEFADDDKSVEAQVARMESALKAGRAAQVLSLASALSPRAKAPAADWLAKIEARGAIETALSGIEGNLKSSLGGTAPAAAAPKGN